MNVSSKLDQLHARVRGNKWFRYFAVFSRIALAAGFLPSGLTKVLGERFTVLAVAHPMGHYLDALYQTGFYYTSIGVMQVTAAILLLIPRTATLGAVIYFPIILNICILSLAVRFEGSLLTSPLMVLANLYLLCWDYHKLKFILPFSHASANKVMLEKKDHSNKFPLMFFTGVFTAGFIMVLVNTHAYKILPRNTISECRNQCKDNKHPDDCYDFCDCIHIDGFPLNNCLEDYKKASEDAIKTD